MFQDGGQIIQVAAVASQFMTYQHQIVQSSSAIFNVNEINETNETVLVLSLVVRIESKIAVMRQVFRKIYLRGVFFPKKLNK